MLPLYSACAAAAAAKPWLQQLLRGGTSLHTRVQGGTPERGLSQLLPPQQVGSRLWLAAFTQAPAALFGDDPVLQQNLHLTVGVSDGTPRLPDLISESCRVPKGHQHRLGAEQFWLLPGANQGSLRTKIAGPAGVSGFGGGRRCVSGRLAPRLPRVLHHRPCGRLPPPGPGQQSLQGLGLRVRLSHLAASAGSAGFVDVRALRLQTAAHIPVCRSTVLMISRANPHSVCGMLFVARLPAARLAV